MYRLLALSLVVLAGLGCSAPPAASDRPNIVFIMTDDQAPWAIGAWDGPTHAETPNLDALFASGTYLPNTFVTTPVCSPSRASIATSRYGSEMGITDWIKQQVEPELGLDPEIVTWYEELQDAGYYTGLVGKWHLGLLDKHHPTQTGFDYFMGHRSGGWSPVDPVLEKDGEYQLFTGLTTDILTDHALEFIGRQPEDQPFLLVLHYRAPHTKWLPVAPEDWEPFDELDPNLPHPDYPGLDVPKAKKSTREYLASIKGVDRNVGRLMQALDDQGIADNTVVVFTSDHGYNMGHNGIWHKGNGHWILLEEALPAATANIPLGQRPNMYDTSLKVPTAIRWPGVTEPGSTVSSSVTFLDWYPTLLRIAGVEPDAGSVIRGRDVTPLLRGESIEWDNDVFAQYSTKHQSRTDMRAYRTPEWKLVRDFLNPERDELFDLVNDPEETTNLIQSPEHQQIVQKLHRELVAEMWAIGDPVLMANEEDWVSLFDGYSLNGWTVKIRGFPAGENYLDTFGVEGGVMTVSYDQYEEFDERFGHIFYNQPFSHYRLRLQYRFLGEQAKNGPGWAFRNSGVMLHSPPPEAMSVEQDFPLSIEVQFLGGPGDGSERATGNMCSPGTDIVYEGEFTTRHCITSRSATYDGDQWVDAEVLVLGSDRIVHYINGEAVMEYEHVTVSNGLGTDFGPDVPAAGEPLGAGYISLQAESHPVQFRNIELLNLKGCMDSDAQNFKTLYVEPDPDSCQY